MAVDRDSQSVVAQIYNSKVEFGARYLIICCNQKLISTLLDIKLPENKNLASYSQTFVF